RAGLGTGDTRGSAAGVGAREVTPVQFTVLGPMRFDMGERSAEVAAGPRRDLLAMLLLRANRTVASDILLDRLWQQPRNADALRRLRVHVHRVRATLDDPDRIAAESGGYRLRVDDGELDAERFCDLVDRAAACADEPNTCVALIRAAMAMWHGAPYEGVDLPDVAAEVQRLAEKRLVGLELLFTAELRRGRPESVLDELAETVARHPLRERLQGTLITALHRSGRRAEALAAFRAARKVMVDELGLEPSAELRALELRILQDEPVRASPAPASASPGPRPMQLPYSPPGFVGREDALAELDWLGSEADTPRICAVVGAGGLGKTALAVHWAHRSRDRFPDGQLFLDLRGYSAEQPLSASEALATLLRSGGIEGAAMPSGTTERAALFRTMVAGSRMLLVLDNAHSADQVRPLLAGGDRCFVIVTSRDAMPGLSVRDGAHRIFLGPMTDREARLLLTTTLRPARPDPEVATRLMAFCARNPLALRIAAERLRSIRSGEVGEFLADLEQRRALDVLDIDGDSSASMRAVLSSSYRHLESATAQLFRMIGVHPGHDLDVYAAAALVDAADAEHVRRELGRLVRAHLLEETARRRYRCHDLVRAFAREVADDGDQATTALRRLLEYYLRTAVRAAILVNALDEGTVDVEQRGAQTTAAPVLHTHDAALTWLDTERTNLVLAVEQAAHTDSADVVTDFSTALGWYLDLGWHLDDAETVHRAAVAVATARGDGAAHGMALRHLALVKNRRGDTSGAVPDMEQAAALLAPTGDPMKRADIAAALGLLYAQSGRTADAVAQLRRAVQLYYELGERTQVHWPLTHLGNLLARQGHWDEAEQRLRAAVDLAQEFASLPSQAHALHGLAVLCRDTGRGAEASRMAAQALAAARAARIPLLEGLVLHELGSIHEHLGDAEQAARRRAEAAAVLRTLTPQSRLP
ncbi:MAG: tetratricopeptide repeat protein, partial [Mycobacteriaceae bacterium]|nr:tetratricopeptide repeat protein [Mycobacteriaceae bacterium]